MRTRRVRNLLRGDWRASVLLFVLVGVFVGSVCWSHATDCGPVEIVGGVDEYDDWGAAIAASPDGTIWAAWTGRDPVQEDEELYYSVNDGAGWTPQQRLHGENVSADRWPRLSVGVDGVPWVIWNRAQSSGYRLWYSRWEGSSWATPQILRTGASRYDHYEIAAVTSDDVWAVTDCHMEGASDRVILTYHWTGDLWEGPWLLSSTDGSNENPDVGVDAAGRPWVVWLSRPSGAVNYDVVCSTLSDTSWASPVAVNDDQCNISDPRIVFDGNVPMVLWTGHACTSMGDVEYSRLEGGSWTPAAPVSAPDGYMDYDWGVNCEASPGGEIWAVWQAGVQGEIFATVIVAARWEGDGWGAEILMSGDATNKEDRHPDAAIGPDESVWAIWQCYEEIAPPWDKDIRAASCTMTSTPVDFCCPEVTLEGEAARVSWYASGDAAYDVFQVWRLCDAGEEPAASAVPPDDARVLNEDPIQGPPFELLDSDLPAGGRCSYWIERRNAAGSNFLGPVEIVLPTDSSHGPAQVLFARPNPASDSWCVGFRQSLPGTVSLSVYDVAGRHVATVAGEPRARGLYQDRANGLCWDGKGGGTRVSSGVYLAKLMFNGRPLPDQPIRLTIIR